MIVTCWEKEDYGYSVDRYQTNGCSCCSLELDAENDRETIIEHLIGNVRVAREACERLGVDFDWLCLQD